MNAASLTLTEYSSHIGCKLDPAQCDLLRTIIPSLRIEPSVAGIGLYDLTPGSWIGALRVGGLSIVIRPKIPIDRVLFLLSYSLDPGHWRETSFDLDQSFSLVDAIVPAFVHHIRRAVRRGLLQQYREEEDALYTIRGRLDVTQHMSRRFGLAPPLDVRFDEFTEDHVLHRIIKAALIALERRLVRSRYARLQLHSVLPLFERVRHESFIPSNLPQIHYSRLTAHYRPAVELAKLILRASSFEHHHGLASATAFLMNMNDVFESFVAIALREALGLSEKTFPRGKALHLDAEQKVTLRPDVSWWEGGRPVFVGDVKYKALGVAGYQHADLYQLLAYAVAADLPGGLLIYALGEGEPGIHRTRHIDRLLEVRWLDLSGTPPTILASVAETAGAVRRLRRKQLEPAA